MQMKKGSKKPKKPILLQSLELLGKPLFLLLTYALKSLSLLKFPRLRLTLPKLHLPKLKRFKLKKPHPPKLKLKRLTLNYAAISMLLMLCFIGTLVYWYILKDLPSSKLLGGVTPSLTTKIYDRNGVLLYQIYKDENRSLIHLADLPPHVIQATIAAEDKNFYHHSGFDPVGITRALLNNLQCSLKLGICNSSLQGGSTITQQLVKNVLLTPERSFTRKLKELVLAVETEIHYSKEEILEMYLNQIGYGGTAYGIEEAAWQYFGKSARDLTLAESAMLAGLPISPTILSPFGTDPYLAKIRQQQVLESMVKSKMITENDKVASLATPLLFHPQGISIRAPHFVMYVKDLLVKTYGEDLVSRGGLEVITTLDVNKQDILQQEINAELNNLQRLHVQNGAGLILAPKTGEILAMVGSRDFFDSSRDGQVNITLQARQPGSSIKPITYTLALMRGASPSSWVEDTPVCFILPGGPDYCPKNYDGRFHGRVTLRTALASSYNIPAIKLLNTYGLNNMINLARNMGITTWEDSSRFGLSLTLGGGEITMLDLAGVYSIFANDGEKVPPIAILSVKNHAGNDLPFPAPEKKQVIPATIAYQINSILSDSLARAPAFGMHSVLNLPGNTVAVKTGTTNDLRDNWTFGYTPGILVATWVGNNDNSPMSSVASGITGASPIWARTMQRLLKDIKKEPFAPPSTMIKVNTSCSSFPTYEYFVPGTAPKINCTEVTGTLLDTAATTAR